MNKKIIIILILTISITACSSVLEVNVKINNIEAGEVEGAGQFERNSIVTLNAKENKGYEFDFWEEDGKRISDENPLVFALEKRRNIKANFKLEKYTINVSSSDNTKGLVLGSGEYKFKDKVVVEANALECFKFCGWEGINSAERIVKFNAENDLRAIAYFTQEETKLIEKKPFKPIVSKDKNLLAYKFDNILSIYSLKEDKTLADFALFSEDINEKEISARWSYDNNKIIINYLDEIIIQGINDDKMI